MIKAIIDRIVDGKHVVLLVGENEEEKVIPCSLLPQGAIEGSWLNVQFEGDQLVLISLDYDETEGRKKRIQDKMNFLRQRSKNREK
jgi:hypothetical protein